jgi:hypothetical protein
MSEDSWPQARLIPVSGIAGAGEQQHRATSALLAVIGSVREFGRAVTQPLGAPAGRIEAFIDVPFCTAGRDCLQDGLIRVRGDQRTWTALVRVRTGRSGLDATALETSLDVAREQGFDLVLTISNDRPDPAGRPPVTVDERKLHSVALHHYAWNQLLAEAVTQRDQRGPAEPEPAWVLSELIRYLEDPRSGTLESEENGADRGPELPPGTRSLELPEPREPVREVDLREPKITVLHTVLVAEPAARMPPTLPSRREVRMVRHLGVNAGDLSAGQNDAGWYQDPEEAALLRWWDGLGWSEFTFPAQPAHA